jgi:hypothetical protein
LKLVFYALSQVDRVVSVTMYQFGYRVKQIVSKFALVIQVIKIGVDHDGGGAIERVIYCGVKTILLSLSSPPFDSTSVFIS